jgi:hypothetical protein
MRWGSKSAPMDLRANDNVLLCEYKIADGCAATSLCARIIVPTCNHVTGLCGCDGKRVIAGEESDRRYFLRTAASSS